MERDFEIKCFGGGRLVSSDNGLITPNYQITDHLGSVRVIFTTPPRPSIGNPGTGTVIIPPTGGTKPPIGGGFTPTISEPTIIAQNDYFAFGLRHENPNYAQSTTNRYLFNGKEFQSTGSVDLLDYGARMYNERIGRWQNPDPLAEEYQSFSTYNYAVNNPVKFIDPDGKAAMFPEYFNLNGKYLENVSTGDGNARLVLTTSSRDRNVQEAIDNGHTTTLPTREELGAMETAYDLTEQTGNEHYFSVGNGEIMSDIVEGDRTSISPEKKLEAARSLYDKGGSRTIKESHTHTPLDSNGKYGESYSSSGDRQDIRGEGVNTSLGYKDYTPFNQVGGSDVRRQINFYNKDGDIKNANMEFDKFKKNMEKANDKFDELKNLY